MANKIIHKFKRGQAKNGAVGFAECGRWAGNGGNFSAGWGITNCKKCLTHKVE